MSKHLSEIAAVVDNSPSLGLGPEAGADVFSPDILTPAQYYAAHVTTPYHRLLVAVLEDAIRCYQRTLGAQGARQRFLFRETKEWLFDKRATIMSCSMICESLGIDVSCLRRYMRKYNRKTTVGEKPQRLPRRVAVHA